MAAMTNCPYCGKLTDPNLDNCPHCGGAMQSRGGRSGPAGAGRQQTQTCPNCDAIVKDGDIICVACGTNLLTGEKVTPEQDKEERPPAVPQSRGRFKWVIAAGVLLVLLIGVAAALALYAFTRDPVQKAKQLAMGRNYLEASAVLNDYLGRNPQDARAHMVLGKVYWQSNQFLNAANAFENAANLIAGSPEPGLMAVLNLASVPGEDTLGRQVEILGQLAQRFPDNPRIAYLLALAAGVKGDSQTQIEALKKTVALELDNSQAQFDLGVALALQDAYEQAAKRIGAAVSAGLTTGDALATQGLVSYRLGQVDEAAQRLAESLQKESSIKEQARLRLGLIRISQGRFSEAMSLLADVPQAGSAQKAARFFRGVCLAATGSNEQALTHFEALGREKGPYSAEANLQAAYLYLAQNRIADARDAVERAAQFGGGGPVLETLRGRIHMRTDEVRQAQNAFRRAIRADESYAPAHLENGLAYVARGVLSEGIRELETYIELVMAAADGQTDIETRVNEVKELLDQLKQTETVEKTGSAEVAANTGNVPSPGRS